jgi:hypothetical protein
MTEQNNPGLGKVTCPGCGVTVAIGYPACPKCKAALPKKAVLPGKDAQKGGTSAATQRPLGMVVVAVMTAILLALFFGRGSDDKPADTGVAAKPGASTAENPQKTAQPPAPGIARTAAQKLVITLEQRLRAVGLLAWVDQEPGDPKVVLIRLDSCKDGRLRPTLDGLSTALGAEFASWRCVERFGRATLEEVLPPPPPP